MKVDPGRGYKLLPSGSIIPPNAEWIGHEKKWRKTSSAFGVYNATFSNIIYRVPITKINNIIINEDGSYDEV